MIICGVRGQKKYCKFCYGLIEIQRSMSQLVEEVSERQGAELAGRTGVFLRRGRQEQPRRWEVAEPQSRGFSRVSDAVPVPQPACMALVQSVQLLGM